MEVDNLSKYRDVYSDIKKNILTNHYRAGTQLPTQKYFAEKYEISRITLKKALNLLENEGLIYSKQGSGTFVRNRIDTPSEEMLPLDLPVGVTHSHRDQKIKSKLLHFDARLPNKKEQKELLLDQHSPVYEYKRVRFINDQVHSFEHSIMPVEVAPLNEEILMESVYDYLGTEMNLQLTDARRIIYATKADKEISEALEIEEGEAIFVIEQVAYDQNGKAFELSKSAFKNEQTKFVLDVHINEH